jgi:hypothetical protein
MSRCPVFFHKICLRNFSLARLFLARPRLAYALKYVKLELRAYPEKGSDPLNLGGLTPFPDRL